MCEASVSMRWWMWVDGMSNTTMQNNDMLGLRFLQGWILRLLSARGTDKNLNAVVRLSTKQRSPSKRKSCRGNRGGPCVINTKNRPF